MFDPALIAWSHAKSRKRCLKSFRPRQDFLLGRFHALILVAQAAPFATAKIFGSRALAAQACGSDLSRRQCSSATVPEVAEISAARMFPK